MNNINYYGASCTYKIDFNSIVICTVDLSAPLAFVYNTE